MTMLDFSPNITCNFFLQVISMKVNGAAFKAAREEIFKNANHDKLRLRGEAAEGTQEWLAQVAMVKSKKDGSLKPLSVRTVQYLEKGEASIQTIDAVSPFLGLNGRELIIGYGINQINCSTLNVIDFRPTDCPSTYEDTFQDSPFLFTIDPLQVSLSEGDLTEVKLNLITAILEIGGLKINFSWIYRVALNPTGKGWLGILQEVYPEKIYAPYNESRSIMFHQPSYPFISWLDFINLVDSEKLGMIKIIVTFHFDNFIKEMRLGVSIKETGTFFDLARQSRNGKCPRFVQPSALLWE